MNVVGMTDERFRSVQWSRGELARRFALFVLFLRDCSSPTDGISHTQCSSRNILFARASVGSSTSRHVELQGQKSFSKRHQQRCARFLMTALNLY
jgi:hypothetical protein